MTESNNKIDSTFYATLPTQEKVNNMPSGATYNCKWCDFSSTQSYIVGHVVDKHPVELYNHCKIDIRLGAKGRSSRVGVIHDKASHSYLCCYGCSKFWARDGLAHKHYTDCPNKDKHKAVCAKLIPEADNMAKASEDDTDLVAKLKKELESLQRQVEKANNRVKAAERDAQMADTLLNCIKELGDQPFLAELATKCQEYDEENNAESNITIDWDDELY